MKTGTKLRNSILCGMFALAGTALAVGWNASEAEAAKTFGGKNVKITIDYDQQTMCIEDNGKDAQLQVGVATYKPATKNKDEYLTVPAWEIYDNTVEDGGVIIDLSRLKNTNDNYIEIKGNNNSEPIAILFPKVEKGVIASYNAKIGQVGFYISAAAKKEGDTITEGLEYRTSTGRWTAIENWEEHDISKYQQGGATLYYRMRAQYDGNSVSGNPAVKLDVTDDAPGEIGGVPLFTAGSFAGVEKKVTISKLANGPKITVNYATGQFSLGVGQEYRIFDANIVTANSLPDFIPIDEDVTKAQMTSLDLDKPFILELRKAAVDEKSLATKATQLVCAKQGILSSRFEEGFTNKVFDIVNETTSGNRISVVTDDEIESEDGEETDGIGPLELYGEYNEKTKKYTLGVYNFNTLYAYDIIVTDEIPDKNVKGFTAVAKKTTKVKKLTIAGDGKVVYARRQANAALKSWRTEWKPVGKLVPKSQ